MKRQKSDNPASFTFWQKRQFKKWTKAITLVITTAFIMPTISWSFDIGLYLEKTGAETELGGPGSDVLAKTWQLPPYIGQVVEASYRPDARTVVLIQDLHCNYEIQKNIRSILTTYTKKQPSLRLVAVEGASGIIPTLDLAWIQDSPAKRAVADYFMQQGKLTGADCFTLCDKKTVELFGAEEEVLYEDSLTLIRGFSTEENRGIMMELADQLQMIKNKVFNKALLNFEKDRMSYRMGEISSRAYQYYLTKVAEKNNVPVYPAALALIAAKRSLNYHEKQIQEQYLEYTLLNKLAITGSEKKLVNYQHYTDLIERIINVSASSQDLINYKKSQSELTLNSIAQHLKNQLGTDYIDLETDLVKIEKAVSQSLAFYQLAEKRNHAIYGNTMNRLNARKEKAVVLITGGFHTDEISKLAKKQGHSVVVVQPNLSGMEYSSNYYDLLIYPDKPTEFENMVVRSFGNLSAIAVKNFVINNGFRTLFSGMVQITKAAMGKLKGQEIAIAADVELVKVAANAVRVSAPDGMTAPQVIKVEGEEVSVLSQMAYDTEVENAKAEGREPFAGSLRSMITENDAFRVFKGVLASTPIGAVPVMMAEQSMLVDLSDMEEGLGYIKIELQKEKAEAEAKEKGERVDDKWENDGNHVQYLTYADIRESLKIWEKLGLTGSADLKIIEFYAEPVEGFSKKDRDRGVIVSKVMDRFTIEEFKTWVNRQIRELERKDPNEAGVVDEIKHLQHALEYAERAYNNPANNPEKDIIMIQKIEVRHPLATDLIDKRIVWSYMPEVIVEGLQKSGRLKALFAEIPQNLRGTVIKMLEEARLATKDVELIPTRELAGQLLKDGVLHEDYHEKIFKHTEEDLERAQKLLPKLPRGRIFFKNFIKALSGIQYFRLVEKADDPDFSDPSEVTWDLALRLFLTEMICDLVPMQLKKRAGEQHIYESQLGETISPEWESFLNELIDRHVEDFNNGQAAIYKIDHLATSKYYDVRGVNASMLAPVSLAEPMIADQLGVDGLTLPNLTRPKINKVEVGAPAFTDESLMDLLEENEGKNNLDEDQNSLLALMGEETSAGSERESDSKDVFSLLDETSARTEDTGESIEDLFVSKPDDSKAADRMRRKVSAEVSFDNVAAGKTVEESLLFGGFEEKQSSSSVQSQTDQTQEGQSAAVVRDNRNYGMGSESAKKARALPKTIFDIDTSPIPHKNAKDPNVKPDGTDVFMTDLSGDVGSVILNNNELVASLSANQRATFTLGKATEMLGRLDRQEVLTIGVDSPDLARVLEQAIAARAVADPTGFALLVDRIEIKTFPQNIGMTNANKRPTYTMPSNWTTNPVLAVYTMPSTAATQYTTLKVNDAGVITTGVEMAAIPMDEAVRSFRGTGDWSGLLTAHNRLLGTVNNPDALKGFLLIDRDKLTSSQQELLRNYDFDSSTVVGFKNLSNTQKGKLPLAAIKKALEAAFESGKKEMIVQLNIASYNQIQAAMAQPNVELLNFNARNAVISSSVELGYNLNTVFMNDAYGTIARYSSSLEEQYKQAERLRKEMADRLDELNENERKELLYLNEILGMKKLFHAVALDMQVGFGFNEGFVEDEETRNTISNNNVALLRQRLSDTLGKAYVDRLSDDDLASVVEELNDLDTVTTMSPPASLLYGLDRFHGRAWEGAPSLFKNGAHPLDYLKSGKMPQSPAVPIDGWQPQVEKTEQGKAKGVSKLKSALLLGFAAGALIADALIEAFRAPKQKGVSRFSKFMTFYNHPGRKQAFSMMADVVFGRSRFLDMLTPMVRQQLHDMQTLAKEERDLATLPLDQVPHSLKYSQGQFKQFKARLEKNTVFKILKSIARLKDLNPLYSDLFILVNEGNNLQNIMWYIAPAETLRKNFVQLGGMDTDLDNKWDGGLDYQLGENLNRSVDLARSERDAMNAEREELLKSDELDARRIIELQQGIRDRAFSVSINNALNRLSKENTEVRVHIVVRILLRELNRHDVSQEYYDGIFKLLSVIDPFNQRAVQVRVADNDVSQMMLPSLLLDTTLRDYFLYFYEVYDQQGEPLLPFFRRAQRFGASA